MMETRFELAIRDWQLIIVADTNNGNDYPLSSTCPTPGRVIKHTQKQEELSLFGRLDAPSWRCFKENMIMITLQDCCTYLLGRQRLTKAL